jgi:apolipoprotein N-acyltransferase
MSPSPAHAQLDSMARAARPDRHATKSAAQSKPGGDNVCRQVGEHRLPWHQSTLAVGLLGSLLLFAALPPLDWWPLAWVATLPWLVLIVRPRLEGRRPVLALYLASFTFWLATCHWVRLAHWAAYFGWVAMAAYLAVYSFLFMLLARVAVHRLRISVVLAAPVIWTGLEVVRGYALGGFTMSSVAHTQYRWHAWIQLADVIGCYGLNGVVVLVSACLLRMMPIAQQPRAIWPVVPLAVAFAVPLGYGLWRTNGEHTRPGTTVALIQGAIDTSFDDEPGKDQHVMQHYAEVTGQARDQRLRDKEKDAGVADIALYVWPESMFRRSLVSFSEDFEMPAAMERWANGKSKEEIES